MKLVTDSYVLPPHGIEADFIRREVNSKRSCSDRDGKPSKADFPGFSVFLSTLKPLSYSWNIPFLKWP